MGMVLASKLANQMSEAPVELKPSVQVQNRLGLHYFPDTIHYRVKDVETWLPELKKMGIAWLTLIAPVERAIPEFFIRSLIEASIQPVLHFQIPAQNQKRIEISQLLLSSYARWGVKYAAFFDQPNSRTSWSPSDWAQPDLVERFMDLFIPIAETALDEGLVPVFPPLKPGGDYWDLSFLESALKVMHDRGRTRLQEFMALGAYAWINRKPVSWGIGGPGKWPESQPYFTPPSSQDQLGFRIFDWYESIAMRRLGKPLPILLLRAGSIPIEHLNSKLNQPDWNAHAGSIMSAVNVLEQNESTSSEERFGLDQVVACNFWLVSAPENSEYASQAWFQADGRLPIVSSFYRHHAQKDLFNPDERTDYKCPQTTDVEFDPSIQGHDEVNEGLSNRSENSKGDVTRKVEPVAEIQIVTNLEESQSEQKSGLEAERPIFHYVLLPLYAWGASDWDMSIIQPLLFDSHPTVGFSLAEARHAERVTVVGGEGAISFEALEMLKSAGCVVDRVRDDGTLFAP